jgi:hypothetical protein
MQPKTKPKTRAPNSVQVQHFSFFGILDQMSVATALSSRSTTTSDPSRDPQFLEEEQKRIEQRELSRAVIVSNIPKITAEKYEKLCTVLRKVFQQVGNLGSDALWVPQDENQNTKGFALITYETPEEALKAVIQLNDYPLDKAHTLQVKTLLDVERIVNTPETFEPPTLPAEIPSDPASCPNLYSWLLDERGRDQFMIRHKETDIYWFDALGIPPQWVRETFILQPSTNRNSGILARKLDRS